MNDIDRILKELGQFGRYQIVTYILLFFPIALYGCVLVIYTFSTADVNYRCYIPECELENSQYYQSWLQEAIPFENGKVLDHCLRYKPLKNSSNGACSKDIFSNETEKCEKYIFENDLSTITNEFNLLCSQNEWKRTMVGSLANVGMFISMPITGMLSDRFGRKKLLIWSVILTSISGTVQSFSTTYNLFVSLEVLNAVFYSGVYSSFYILAVETVGPDMRGIGGNIIMIFFSIGEMFLGATVWLFPNWRIFLRIIYIPYFIIIVIYSWILPESVRWLINHNKKDEVSRTMKRIAHWNNKALGDDIKRTIDNLYPNFMEMKPDEKMQNGREKYPLKEALKSKTIILRVLILSICWMTHVFIYFGLSFNAVSIPGNRYLNFIIVCLVEIPGYIISSVILNKYGRKISLCGGLVISGTACLAFHFTEKGTSLNIITYFIGKMAITGSFGALYVIASEIFPTSIRNSLFGFCSTIGRIGNMLSPQTPLLAKYMDPVLVFSVLSFIAAVLGSFFPETKLCSMPDTLQASKDLGKKKSEEVKNPTRNDGSDTTNMDSRL